MPEKPGRTRWLAAALAGVLLVAAAGAWLFKGIRSDSPAGARHAGVGAQKQSPEFPGNLGATELQSPGLARADDLLLALVQAVPEARLMPRDRAIFRLFTLQQIDPLVDPRRFAETARQAEEALRQMQEAEGETAALYVLRGRLALMQSDPGKAVDVLQRAARLSPDDAAVHFDLYQAQDASSELEVRDQAADTLQRVCELAPENLYALSELLRLQRRRSDEEITRTLSRLQEALSPFAEGLRLGARVNIEDLLERAQQAAEDADWPAAFTLVDTITNTLRRDELTRSDRLRIERHWLALTLQDFGEFFRNPGSAANDGRSTVHPLTFRAWPTSSRFTSLDDVRDIRLADFNFDGRVEVLVLRAAAVEVYARDEEESWQLSARGDLQDEFNRLEVLRSNPPDARNVIGTSSRRQGGKRSAADSPAGVLPPHLPILVAGRAGIRLFGLQSSPDDEASRLVPIALGEGLDELHDVRMLHVADLDHDGNQDLVISSARGLSLWSQAAPLRFRSLDGRAQLPPSPFAVTAAVTVDWDHDTDPDIVLLAGEKGTLGYLENLKQGRFRFHTVRRPLRPIAGLSSLAVRHRDTGLSTGLLLAGDTGLLQLWVSAAVPGSIRLIDLKPIEPGAIQGVQVHDLNGDGNSDLVTWSANQVTCSLQIRGKFVPHETGLPAFNEIRTVQAGDLDRDGDLDLAVVDREGIWLFVSQGGEPREDRQP